LPKSDNAEADDDDSNTTTNELSVAESKDKLDSRTRDSKPAGIFKKSETSEISANIRAMPMLPRISRCLDLIGLVEDQPDTKRKRRS
jgi:hypothetical protein